MVQLLSKFKRSLDAIIIIAHINVCPERGGGGSEVSTIFCQKFTPLDKVLYGRD